MTGPTEEARMTEPGLAAVLARFGSSVGPLLGSGGEAHVFELDDDRVLRVLNTDDQGDLEDRAALLDELVQGGVPVAVPRILELGSVGPRHYAVEQRLPGRPVGAELGRLDRSGRDRLIVAHLDAASVLGDLHLEPRAWFGDLIGRHPVRSSSWDGYLVERASQSLRQITAFEHVDCEALARAMPTCDEASFVHLDAFAGNMLADGADITAVIDIGTTSIAGDRRLDPLSAAAYFCAEPITPVANDADRRTVQAWLRNAGLDQWYEPARRWLAAFWAWAEDDADLHRWCRSVLL